jgi:hypothetical protein
LGPEAGRRDRTTQGQGSRKVGGYRTLGTHRSTTTPILPIRAGRVTVFPDQHVSHNLIDRGLKRVRPSQLAACRHRHP